MSYSKLVPPFIFDSLYYLNRDQLERFSVVCRPLKNFIERYFQSKPYRVFDRIKIRGGSYALRHNYVEQFSIVCRPLKNIIERYFHSKPYRIFDHLYICGGSYGLIHNDVQWHPNRDDYSIQQFLANQKCIVDEHKQNEMVWRNPTYYSFAEMRPYLGPTVRIKSTAIYVSGGSFYNPAEMESIAYLWQNGRIDIWPAEGYGRRICADDFLPILNSPTILQCRKLSMENAHFSFKEYKVLFTVNTIDVYYCFEEIDPEHWVQFLEQPGVKPVIFLRQLYHETIDNVLNKLCKAFSSAVSPNAFKIVFIKYGYSLTEFRATNKVSGEKLELKKGIPMEDENELNQYKYTLERSSV